MNKRASNTMMLSVIVILLATMALAIPSCSIASNLFDSFLGSRHAESYIDFVDRLHKLDLNSPEQVLLRMESGQAVFGFGPTDAPFEEKISYFDPTRDNSGLSLISPSLVHGRVGNSQAASINRGAEDSDFQVVRMEKPNDAACGGKSCICLCDKVSIDSVLDQGRLSCNEWKTCSTLRDITVPSSQLLYLSGIENDSVLIRWHNGFMFGRNLDESHSALPTHASDSFPLVITREPSSGTSFVGMSSFGDFRRIGPTASNVIEPAFGKDALITVTDEIQKYGGAALGDILNSADFKKEILDNIVPLIDRALEEGLFSVSDANLMIDIGTAYAPNNFEVSFALIDRAASFELNRAQKSKIQQFVDEYGQQILASRQLSETNLAEYDFDASSEDDVTE